MLTTEVDADGRIVITRSADIRTTEVETPQGKILGRLQHTPDGDALSYLGIPFADGSRRFRPAGPAPTWNGVREAVTYGPGAPQEPSRAVGFGVDENACLNINVWAPADTQGPLPVLVWIHGGGHLYGSNSHVLCDGARLAASEGIIVAAANYRLGALGYLTLDHLLGDEYADSANLALLDAIAALRWVRDSIPSFGGDPANVTLMGQSAGAVMVATLLSMDAAAGLFHRVIVESGSPERAGDRAYGERLTTDLMAKLGIVHAEDLLDVPWPTLVQAQEAVVRDRSAGQPHLDLAFQPAIDGRSLTRVPLDAIAAGAGSDVQVIVGTNVNEASGFVNLRDEVPGADAILSRQLEILLPDFDGDRLPAYRDAVDTDTGRANSTAELLESCLADIIYRQPSQRLLDARCAARASTRSYLFAWEQSNADWVRKAGHSLELPFVFRHLDDSPAAAAEVGEDAPRALRDRMSSAWATFTRTGEPAEWSTYGSTRTVLHFDEDPPSALVEDPRGSIRRLVDSATPRTQPATG